MKLPFGLLLAAGALGAGLWAITGGHPTKAFAGSRTRSRHPRGGFRGLGGESEQTELKLYIDNDGDLYRRQTTSIIKNLATKMAKGVYDRSKAEKLWGYLVESGAKKYTREFDAPDAKWHNVFDISDRRQVAKELNDDFLTAWKEGSYRGMLPKKYQKSA